MDVEHAGELGFGYVGERRKQARYGIAERQKRTDFGGIELQRHRLVALRFDGRNYQSTVDVDHSEAVP